jgi:hypothetical protein
MKNKILKGWHAVEYMQEQKERINKIIKDMSFEEKRKYYDDSLSSIPKNDPLYRIINLSKQLAVNESKANYGIKGNSPDEEDKKEIIKRDV